MFAPCGPRKLDPRPPDADIASAAVPDNHFDGWVAESYDAHEADMFEPEVLEPMVGVLADLAAGGGALEFAIGTGRVALPLAVRGVTVVGIELSDAMVEQLRTKPGG